MAKELKLRDGKEIYTVNVEIDLEEYAWADAFSSRCRIEGREEYDFLWKVVEQGIRKVREEEQGTKWKKKNKEQP